MPTIELHSAFVFDCEACGRESFVRAVEADLDEPVAQEIADSCIAEFFAAIPEEQSAAVPDGDVLYSPTLVTHVALAPPRVTCPHCGAVMETVLAANEDSADEE